MLKIRSLESQQGPLTHLPGQVESAIRKSASVGIVTSCIGNPSGTSSSFEGMLSACIMSFKRTEPPESSSFPRQA